MSIRASSSTSAIRITAGFRHQKRTFVVEYPPSPIPRVGELLNMPDGSKMEIRKVQKVQGPLYFVSFPMKPENVDGTDSLTTEPKGRKPHRAATPGPRRRKKGL